MTLRHPRGSRSGQRGSVTAETAIALPALVVVLSGVLWLVATLGAHLRCLDAAREAARALARGEPAAVVQTIVAAAAPGADFTVRRGQGTVTVTVTDLVAGPGQVLAGLPGARVAASTTALTEQSPAGLPAQP